MDVDTLQGEAPVFFTPNRKKMCSSSNGAGCCLKCSYGRRAFNLYYYHAFKKKSEKDVQ